ncbi:MAG: aldo/keto reductase [Anaerolineaceae bacterium]|nr:aldo/keto reductase [Anaerolineaceae bacterium]
MLIRDADTVRYTNLGRTGLKISVIGLGCGNFGGIGSAPAFFGKGESEEEAFAIMDTAWEMGINFFDTADAYGGGRSETAIGKWMKAKGAAVRDQLILSSKVFNPVGDGPNDYGLSRRHILRQVERSLQRLGVDHIDMYLMHEPDPTTPLEETIHAMDDLVRQGKVHYIGASNMPAWLMTKALWISDKYNLHRFEWIQNSYSLLERTDDREVLPLVADQGLGYTPFSPLAGGWLTGKYTSAADFTASSRMGMRPEPYQRLINQNVFDGLAKFKAEADKRGVSMGGLAIAWLLSNPLITAPIIGPRKPAHFQPVEEALKLNLQPAERDELTALFPGL